MKKFFTIVLLISIVTISLRAQDDKDPVYLAVQVDTTAEYIGGNRSLFEFIGVNMQYPKEAIVDGAQGVVYVQFTIEKDGTITNISVVRGIHPACDAEAKRIVEMMPPWKPAYKNGNPVRFSFMLPIKFVLSFKE